MIDFDKWDREFREQNLSTFNNNFNGLLWLKVRAICRGKQLRQFLKDNDIALTGTKVSEQNRELYALLAKRSDAMAILDKFLQCMNHEWYNEKGVDINQLKHDLYKVHSYSWGGDRNNSLDKYFVSRYVKVISDFNQLYDKQAEIGENAWNYVQNSWYNNWSSFIIESLFKRNPKVISAVGEIKSVDFFIDNYPLDLKVTFFPTQFLERKIKDRLCKSEIAWLKGKCKDLGITCDTAESTQQQVYTLTEKLKEIGRTDIIDQLNNVIFEIIEQAQNDPTELMRWLYENQGEMRFGAENRIYLILVDSKDLKESWKLKRAFSLIEPKVQKYIDSFTSSSLNEIRFVFKGKTYTALSDIIFVIK
ncbi:MAG: hypothetical protein ACI30P_02615 [Muribaculaceae bacterium]|nr:hypothetical protein [Bacteroidales bacterium]MDD6722824.1 hypothetical protein [Bacteroidales bacterium]